MKRILTIIAVFLLTTLSISVVSLAFIKADFNEIPLNNIQAITIYNEGDMTIEANTENEAEKEIYNKVLKLYKNSTKDAVLSGLFGGAFTSNAKATISGPTSMQKTSGMYIEIRYKNDSLPTIKLNGKVYSTPNGTTNIKFGKARIMLGNTETLTTAVTHLILPEVGSSSPQSYRLESIAKQHELVEYLNELKEEGVWFKN